MRTEEEWESSSRVPPTVQPWPRVARALGTDHTSEPVASGGASSGVPRNTREPPARRAGAVAAEQGPALDPGRLDPWSWGCPRADWGQGGAGGARPA